MYPAPWHPGFQLRRGPAGRRRPRGAVTRRAASARSGARRTPATPRRNQRVQSPTRLATVRRQPSLKKAAEAKRESKHTDFKAGFDLASPQAWCEVVRHRRHGELRRRHHDLRSLRRRPHLWRRRVGRPRTRSAVVTDKIAKYTGEQFAEFEDFRSLTGQQPGGWIAPVSVPLVFTSPGTYDIGGGKQKTALPKGTVYFRHGAKE